MENKKEYILNVYEDFDGFKVVFEVENNLDFFIAGKENISNDTVLVTSIPFRDSNLLAYVTHYCSTKAKTRIMS